jgi:uracil-DNA glycosylase family 4
VPAALAAVQQAILTCNACPRLRAYCTQVGRDRRPAYQNDLYWARPVPGWGDPAARILLLGLAPAAHGANRTGRLFTGDVPGGSSDFLMKALHACGLASLPHSRSADDGLVLTDVWISAAVRCAPPDNAPLPREVERCFSLLEAEWRALPRANVVLALGRLAFDVAQRLLISADGPQRRHAFEHGGVYRCGDGQALVASYHPSRQNTQTGRLTQRMLRRAIRRAKTVAG